MTLKFWDKNVSSCGKKNSRILINVDSPLGHALKKLGFQHHQVFILFYFSPNKAEEPLFGSVDLRIYCECTYKTQTLIEKYEYEIAKIARRTLALKCYCSISGVKE